MPNYTDVYIHPKLKMFLIYVRDTYHHYCVGVSKTFSIIATFVFLFSVT